MDISKTSHIHACHSNVYFTCDLWASLGVENQGCVYMEKSCPWQQGHPPYQATADERTFHTFLIA